MANTKFSNDDIYRIFDSYYVDDMTLEACANLYDTSTQSISHIVTRRTYKHVDSSMYPSRKMSQNRAMTSEQIRQARRVYWHNPDISLPTIMWLLNIDVAHSTFRRAVMGEYYKDVV